MNYILKAEIKYFVSLVLAIIIPPLGFTIFATAKILPFQGTGFLTKYFWSLVIGMGTYLFVFIIWSIRKKEIRDSLHSILPVSINNIAVARLIFGAAPFLLIYIYIESHRLFLSAEQVVFISKINAQLGMMFFALVSVDLVMNAWSALTHLKYGNRLLYSFLFVVCLIAASFVVVYSVTMSLLKPFYLGGEEFYFMLWGLVLSIIDAVIFTNRKSFLSY